VPEHRIPALGARIMDLQDPTRKMSTTGGGGTAGAVHGQGTVYVLDEPHAIEKKIRSAVTDSGTEIRRAPEKPGVSNLIEILAVARAFTPEAVEAELANARGYGDLKAEVAAAVIDYLAPVRERYPDLRADEAALEAVLTGGAARARAIAAPTLADVRERMGVGAVTRDGHPS
jgi:tryptophanyl-tRNA synthetase